MVEVIKSEIIRVQSNTNDWIDCIFLVDEDEKERAVEVLEKAYDDFWNEGEGWCYGDFLEARLLKAGIAFDAYYADAEE